jgi:hypothetical protein
MAVVLAEEALGPGALLVAEQAGDLVARAIQIGAPDVHRALGEKWVERP